MYSNPKHSTIIVILVCFATPESQTHTHSSCTVALVLPWQWLTGVCRATLQSQTWDIWESRPPVMSTFPWVLCGWGGGGRSSQELVRATGTPSHPQTASLSLTGTTHIHSRCRPPGVVCQLSLTSQTSSEQGELPLAPAPLTGDSHWEECHPLSWKSPSCKHRQPEARKTTVREIVCLYVSL